MQTIKNQLDQAMALMKKRALPQAKLLLQPLVLQDPKQGHARILLAQCLALEGNKQEATSLLSQVLANYSDINTVNTLAELCLKLGLNLDFVLTYFPRHVKTSKTAAYNWAYYTQKNDQPRLAVERYHLALNGNIPNKEEVHINLGKIYSEELADIEKSELHLHRALKVSPDHPKALFNLANCMEQKGDRFEAIRLFQRCRQADPTNTLALARLLDLSTEPNIKKTIEEAKGAVGATENIDLLYALGRAFESVGDYESAWRYYTQANDQNSKTMPAYNSQATSTAAQTLMNTCDLNWTKNNPADNEAKPIFITGMFRSGTTLLEQMLATHDQISAGGERNFLPKLFGQIHNKAFALSRSEASQLAEEYLSESERNYGARDFLIDKRPDNFLLLGLIHKLFPQSKMIVIVREWKDVAISIYSHRFGPMQRYANDMANIKHYYHTHLKVVNHWLATVPDSILVVNYEELVQKPETILRTLCKYLAIEFQESMLNFHARKSVIQTPSVWQVRQPLHSNSHGRWKNFEQLCPLYNS